MTYYEKDVVELLQLQFQLWAFFATLNQVPCMFDLLMFVQEQKAFENIDAEAELVDSLTKNQGLAEPPTPTLETKQKSTNTGDPCNRQNAKIRIAPKKLGSFWDRTGIPMVQFNTTLGNPSLPAFQSKQEFLDMLRLHPAMVVTGETGSGKTTQIPQFILQDYPNSKVVICQPRRIAATSVATRVADELNSKVGETVGYMVRGDSKVGEVQVECHYICLKNSLYYIGFRKNASSLLYLWCYAEKNAGRS